MVWFLGALMQTAAAAPPAGSYLQTCQRIRVAPMRLAATCQTTHGTWQRSMLMAWQSCTGDIANRDGALVCEVPEPEPLPPGSYRQTCIDVVRVGPDLEATCRRRDGQWQATRLPRAVGCRGDIANLDGQLSCLPSKR